jgi:CYTH domain-containing protein
MTIRRRFLLAPSLARLIQRERPSLRQVEGFFPEQRDRSSWVHLEESRALLILRTATPSGDVEEQTEVPVAHGQALLDVCAGAIDYSRTALPVGHHTVFIDQFFQPRGLHLVSVEFDRDEEARGFDPLPWFGPEVTGDRRYSNQALALHDFGTVPEDDLSNAALESLLDTLENRFTSRERIPVSRPTARQVPATTAQVNAPAQEQGTKVNLQDIEAAMMREMETALQNGRP